MGYIAIGQVGDEAPAITKSTTESYIKVSQMMSQNWTFTLLSWLLKKHGANLKTQKIRNDTKMFFSEFTFYIYYTLKNTLFLSLDMSN